MSCVLSFNPKGARTWEVSRDGQVIAIIQDKYAVLTSTSKRDLDIDECAAIRVFISLENQEDAVEYARR